MTVFLKRLALKTGGVFTFALLGLMAADQPFNALTFHWSTALTVSGSAALLALVEGIAGRFVGDEEQPSIIGR